MRRISIFFYRANFTITFVTVSDERLFWRKKNEFELKKKKASGCIFFAYFKPKWSDIKYLPND